MSYEAEEDDEINSVLWVGNLDIKVTESMVYELFLQAGPVKSVHFPKGQDGANHKGYCFVQFYQNASVPYTMEVMEGTMMFGKKLKLQPRPGSIHRKIMDQKIAQKRQEILLQQQQPQLVPQHVGNPVLFGLGPPPPQTPQLAQIQNMVIYQNQMFQPFNPAQNANQYPMATFQPQVGPQIVQIQMQQQQHQGGQQPTHNHQQSTSQQQQSPRQFQQQQIGYSFISSPTHRVQSSHVASLNNSGSFARPPAPQQQLQQQQPHPVRGNNPGGVRSQRPVTAITNGHIVNGNHRMPFHQPRHPNAGAPLQQQHPPPPVQIHQQQQVQLVSPIYHPQQALLSPDQSFAAAAAAAANGGPGTPNNPPPGALPLTMPMPLTLPIGHPEMQFFGRPPGPPPPHQPPLVASPANAAGALGIANGYQNVIYHY